MMSDELYNLQPPYDRVDVFLFVGLCLGVGNVATAEQV
jgi:hypothetical protein